MIKFIETKVEDNRKFLEVYLKDIYIPYDDFYEEWILTSDFYNIEVDNKTIGYFAKKSTRLTQFFLEEKSDKDSLIFKKILEEFQIKDAFLASTDKYFYTIADKYAREIQVQAYHFWDSKKKVEAASYSGLKLATMDDLPLIEKTCGDFFEDYAKEIRLKHLYLLKEGKELLGLGVLINNALMKGCSSTGMFTNPVYRGKGIGRSIIMELMKKTYELGFKPIAGCWSGNILSKKTLESAGYISISSLLRIKF